MQVLSLIDADENGEAIKAKAEAFLLLLLSKPVWPAVLNNPMPAKDKELLYADSAPQSIGCICCSMYRP